MNAQTTYATTTQMLFRFKLTLLPVTMLATKLTAARTRTKAAVRTATSATKARNRDAKPA